MRPDPSPGVTLPITPMLDMSFQLLCFFVLTFRLTPAEGQFSVTRPPIDGGLTAHDPEWPEAELTKDTYMITVTPVAGGVSIDLRGPTAVRAGLGSVAELKDALAGLPKPAGTAVTVEAAADLPYARLIDVLDVCKKAGYDAVNVAAIPARRA